MLNKSQLQSDLEEAITDVFPGVVRSIVADTIPLPSDLADATLDRIEETAKEGFKDFGERLADIIDTYIKSADVFGKTIILTNGSPTSQFAYVTIKTLPTGTGGGNMPITNQIMLGIQ